MRVPGCVNLLCAPLVRPRVCLLQIARQPLVLRVTKPHFWKLQGEAFIGTLHLEVEDECDEQILRKRVVSMLGHCGVSQVRCGAVCAAPAPAPAPACTFLLLRHSLAPVELITGSVSRGWASCTGRCPCPCEFS